MRFRLIPVLCLVAVAALGTPSARADIITYSFTGTADAVDATLAGSFVLGQSLTGTYSFDTAVGPRVGSDTQFGVFDALTALSFSSGTYAASSAGAPEIQVDNNPPSPFVDRYGVVSRASDGLAGPQVNGFDLTFFAFRLDDNDNAVFSNALILPTSLTLADFENRQFFLFFAKPATDENATVSGTITSLTPVNAVPAPPGVLLAGIGLGLAALRWRKPS